MKNEDEEKRIQDNIQIIREYLLDQFKEFELTDGSDGHFGHWFTVSNLSTYRQHRVKVSGPRLADASNTPKRSRRQLALDDVAGRMRDPKNEVHFSLGKP